MKTSGSFPISAHNIECGYSLESPRRGGSNGYSQSIFIEEIKNNVYPCKPQFYCIKVGLKWVKTIKACFCDDNGIYYSVLKNNYLLSDSL